MIKAIIIDDEEDARESLRLTLKKFCPDVEIVQVCEGPKEGLEAIDSHSPDLVFLDVQMPHMSGFDMLEKIAMKAKEKQADKDKAAKNCKDV